MKVKVQSMTSPRTGNSVANQFIINTPDATYFQSYDSVIVKQEYTKHDGRKTYLDETFWNYSRTTSKYRSEFLNESTSETKAKIASGEYILMDLN